MGYIHRDPNTGGGQQHRGRVHDLLGFLGHLLLLPGIAVGKEAVYPRDDVEGDLIGQGLGFMIAVVEHGPGLVLQLRHGRSAGPGDRLVGRGDDTRDRIYRMQWMGYHHHRRGRAVGNGDNALVPLHVLPVDLRDHQWDLGLHAEVGAVVYHQGAGCYGDGGKLSAKLGAGRYEGDVHASEGVVGGLLDH